MSKTISDEPKNNFLNNVHVHNSPQFYCNPKNIRTNETCGFLYYSTNFWRIENLNILKVYACTKLSNGISRFDIRSLCQKRRVWLHNDVCDSSHYDEIDHHKTQWIYSMFKFWWIICMLIENYHNSKWWLVSNAYLGDSILSIRVLFAAR